MKDEMKDLYYCETEKYVEQRIDDLEQTILEGIQDLEYSIKRLKLCLFESDSLEYTSNRLENISRRINSTRDFTLELKKEKYLLENLLRLRGAN